MGLFLLRLLSLACRWMAFPSSHALPSVQACGVCVSKCSYKERYSQICVGPTFGASFDLITSLKPLSLNIVHSEGWELRASTSRSWGRHSYQGCLCFPYTFYAWTGISGPLAVSPSVTWVYPVPRSLFTVVIYFVAQVPLQSRTRGWSPEATATGGGGAAEDAWRREEEKETVPRLGPENVGFVFLPRGPRWGRKGWDRIAVLLRRAWDLFEFGRGWLGHVHEKHLFLLGFHSSCIINVPPSFLLIWCLLFGWSPCPLFSSTEFFCSFVLFGLQKTLRNGNVGSAGRGWRGRPMGMRMRKGGRKSGRRRIRARSCTPLRFGPHHPHTQMRFSCVAVSDVCMWGLGLLLEGLCVLFLGRSVTSVASRSGAGQGISTTASLSLSGMRLRTLPSTTTPCELLHASALGLLNEAVARENQ